MSSFDYTGLINPNPGPDEAGISIYGYVPSMAFAMTAAVTFGLICAIQAWYIIRWKGMYRTFHILLFIGCLTETGGYATRVYSHYRPFVVNGFVASWSMVVLAPVFYTAAIDFTLNILVHMFPGTNGILLLSPRNVLLVFIGTDIISIIVQAAGAAMVGISASAEYGQRSSPISYDNANNILTAGLAPSLAAWVIFLGFLLVAMRRAYKLPFPQLTEESENKMRSLLWVILVSTLLVILRACYRLAETILGFLSGPASNEGMFAGFEYVPIFLAALVWTIFPPAIFSPDHKREKEVRREENRIKEEKKASKKSKNAYYSTMVA